MVANITGVNYSLLTWKLQVVGNSTIGSELIISFDPSFHLLLLFFIYPSTPFPKWWWWNSIDARLDRSQLIMLFLIQEVFNGSSSCRTFSDTSKAVGISPYFQDELMYWSKSVDRSSVTSQQARWIYWFDSVFSSKPEPPFPHSFYLTVLKAPLTIQTLRLGFFSMVLRWKINEPM